MRKAQAEAGDIVLLFSDESEALTHPYLARTWAKRGADLRVPAPGQSRKVAMMGTLDWVQRRLTVTTSRTKRSTDFIAHLQVLDRLYGPKPGTPVKPVVIVLDNGPIHVSKVDTRRPCRARPLAHRRMAARNTPPNSTTLRSSGATSRLIISPTRPLLTPTSSTTSSTKLGRGLELRAKTRSVGQTTNLCLARHEIEVIPAGHRPVGEGLLALRVVSMTSSRTSRTAS